MDGQQTDVAAHVAAILRVTVEVPVGGAVHQATVNRPGRDSLSVPRDHVVIASAASRALDEIRDGCRRSGRWLIPVEHLKEARFTFEGYVNAANDKSGMTFHACRVVDDQGEAPDGVGHATVTVQRLARA